MSLDRGERASVQGGEGGLRDIDGLRADDLWAVGWVLEVDSFVTDPLMVHFDGGSWERVDTPVSPDDDSLDGVAAIGQNDVWAVGLYGNEHAETRSLALHWDGSAWTTVPTPNLQRPVVILEGLAVVAADDVWAVGWGTEGGLDEPMAIHWDGSAWRETPVAVHDTRLTDVVARAPNDVWAVGVQDEFSPDSLAILMHWDGLTWSQVDVQPPDASAFEAVTASGDGSIWAVGSAGSDGSNLALRVKGGSWRRQAVPEQGTFDNVLRGTATIGDDVWAVGGYQRAPDLDRPVSMHRCL